MNDDFEAFVIPGHRARKIDFLAVGISLVGDLLSSFSNAVNGVEELVCSHANYLSDREQFHQEAAVELESLLVGEDEWEYEEDE